LDLQTALDTVSHEIMMYELHYYRICGIGYSWFVNCVHKSSVLGPLLFLIYVNDIANAVPDHNVKMFADDTNLFMSGRNIDLLN
jgi:hypothetical protein